MITPLYIKTNYSLLSSMIKIDELIEYAKKNNYNALTITDNNMYGVMEFYNACKLSNIKPIIGLEVTIDDNIIILYAVNYAGYKNLLKISTIQSEHKISFESINKYSSNLILIVPFASIELYDKLNFDNKYQSYANDLERENLKGNNLIFMTDILYLDEKDQNYINYLYGIKD